MKFCNPKELKDAIRDYEVVNGCEIKIKRNKPQFILAVCVEGCPWKLYASWMRTDKSFQIKTLWPQHKCSRNTSLKIVTQTWLANKYGDKIRKNPTWKTKELLEDVLEKYGLHVSYVQCLRAKRRALGEVENGLRDHYAYLRRYGKELLRSNPRNTVKICVERATPSDPPLFKRMYMCFESVRKGCLEGCRPILGLDGCFLKGYYCGEILATVKNRRKPDHEEPKTSTNNFSFPRTGRQMRYTNCQQVGHNMKSCKNPHVHLRKAKPSKASSSNPATTKKKSVSSRQVKGKEPIMKQTEVVPNGFGVFISPNTGNTFLRMGSSGLPIQLNENQASQPSQVTQASRNVSTPPRRAATQPSTYTRNNTSPAMNTRSRHHTSGKNAQKTLGVKRKIAKK